MIVVWHGVAQSCEIVNRAFHKFRLELLNLVVESHQIFQVVLGQHVIVADLTSSFHNDTLHKKRVVVMRSKFRLINYRFRILRTPELLLTILTVKLRKSAACSKSYEERDKDPCPWTSRKRFPQVPEKACTSVKKKTGRRAE